MSLRFFYIIFSLLLFAGHISAQTVLSLKDAISYTLENNTVLEQARLDIEQGNEVIAETRAMGLPQVNINTSVTGNPIVQQFVLPAEVIGGEPGEFLAIKAGQNWTAMTQLQVSQQIFNKQLFTGIKAAQGSVEYYKLLQELSEDNVIQQVAVNYYMVIITREKLDVITTTIDRINQLEEIVGGQYDAGLVKKIDLNRISVNKSNQEALRVELETALTQQENLLKYYMGMPVHEEIHLPEIPLEDLEKNLHLAVFERDFHAENLLDLKVLMKQQELLGYEKESRRAEYFPTVSLDANYGINTQSDKLNLYTSKALTYDMSGISLRVNIPIFDGYARRSKINQSDISIRKINEEIKNTSNSLDMANVNAKNQVISSLKTISNQKENVVLAMEVLENTQNNYKNGLAPLTDLLNSESELVAAQNSYNEALLNFKIAEIDLARIRGEIKSLLNH